MTASPVIMKYRSDFRVGDEFAMRCTITYAIRGYVNAFSVSRLFIARDKDGFMEQIWRFGLKYSEYFWLGFERSSQLL